MKLTRFKMQETGQHVWVLQHDLATRVGPAPIRTRPIHLLTFALATAPRNALPTLGEQASALCWALEAKLKAVGHFADSMRRAFVSVPPPGLDGRDYACFDEGMAVVAEVEAYLNSIYSSLEITNGVVRATGVAAKVGFRAMAEKKTVEVLTFDRWRWLAPFYDVRTELCHFGSSVPVMVNQLAVVLKITQRRKTQIFATGANVTIPLAILLSFQEGLRSMLDEWAMVVLKSLDPTLKLRQLVFDASGARQGVDVTVAELLADHLA